MNPYIYPQTDILSTLRVLLSEPTAERWTDVQIYNCISIALQGWQGRARVPYVYTITDGWVSGTYDYALPDYIDSRTVQPQAYVSRFDWVDTLQTEGEDTWTDIMGFDVEANAGGGMTLRVHYSQPRSSVVGASTAGRVLWWGQPGQVPSTIPTLSADIAADDTELTIDAKPTIGRTGYVKVGSEWLQYSGVIESASALTLQNLLRGISGTTAALHSLGDTVTWGVAMDSPALLNALYDGTRIYLMQMWLSNPSSRETAQYEKQLVLYQDQLEKFWKGYKSSRQPRMRLSRQVIGDNL